MQQPYQPMDHGPILNAIHKAIKDLHESVKGRPNLEDVHNISSSQPYVVNYRDRYHILLWSANGLTLTLEDLGTMTVNANTWTNISFKTGMKIYAQGQATIVPVFIRCTDSTVY